MNSGHRTFHLNPFLLLPLTFLVVCWVNLNHARWIKKDSIHQDVNGYYSYLPAFFYEQDLSLSFLNDSIHSATEQRYYWPNKTPEGNYVIKYSMGMALCYLPSFAAAHIYCKLTGSETNGFSEPYHFAIQFSSLLYVLLGIYFLIRILQFHFNRKVVWITCVLLLFGTNLLYYMTVWAAMPHAVLFGLIAVFIFQTIRWHQKPGLGITAGLGLLFGLILLIRPVHGLLFILPVLYKVSTVSALKAKLMFFRLQFRYLLLFGLMTFLVFLPQLLYWKFVSGHYLFNSYLNEQFYFLNPHIFKALFGFRKGWFVYTPVLIFIVPGLYLLRKNYRDYFNMIWVFLVVYIYVVFSWWCWWYGGSFGQRTMVDIYALLALPVAAFAERLPQFNKPWKQICQFLLVLFFLLNIFQTMQAKWNVIHYDSMTREAYLDAFFRIKENPDRGKFLKTPDYEKALLGQDEEP